MGDAVVKFFGGAGLAVTFAGWVIFSLSWALHQEARITAGDVSINRQEQKLSDLSDIIEHNRLAGRALQDRVDRQETPLARRVDAIDNRLQTMSDRLLMMEGRINEMLRK